MHAKVLCSFAKLFLVHPQAVQGNVHMCTTIIQGKCIFPLWTLLVYDHHRTKGQSKMSGALTINFYFQNWCHVKVDHNYNYQQQKHLYLLLKKKKILKWWSRLTAWEKHPTPIIPEIWNMTFKIFKRLCVKIYFLTVNKSLK